MKKNCKTAIGLMSGTSMDGIDGCLVKIFDDFKFEILSVNTVSYPDEIRNKLLEIANNNGNTQDICEMDFVTGKLFAKCANELIIKSGLKPDNVDFTASY